MATTLDDVIYIIYLAVEGQLLAFAVLGILGGLFWVFCLIQRLERKLRRLR